MKTRKLKNRTSLPFILALAFSLSIFFYSCKTEIIVFVCSMVVEGTFGQISFDDCSATLDQSLNFMGFFSEGYSLDFSDFDPDQIGSPQVFGDSTSSVRSTFFDNENSTIFFADSGHVEFTDRSPEGFRGTYEAFLSDANGNEIELLNGSFSIPIE